MIEMGQYYFIVNLDKKQYLNPHRFNDGLKACEFGSGGNILKALSCLITKSDEGGGGDWQDESGIAGSWAGDRIWAVGDYDSSKLFDQAEKEFEEISSKVIPVLKKNGVCWKSESQLRPDVVLVVNKSGA